jgi:hypothetical protein
VKASYVPPRRTPVTPYELAQAYEIALGGDGKVSPGHIAVLMAHAALECGRDINRGLIGPSCWNYNLGNVKAGPTYEGLYTCIRLNEYLSRNGRRTLVWFSPEAEEAGGSAARRGAFVGPIHGVPPGHPQTRMRAFGSLAEGIKAKLAFLSAPRFARAVSAARNGTPGRYVDEIHAQKYFTADLAPYRAAVVSLFKSYLPVAEKVSFVPIVLDVADDRMVRVAEQTIKQASLVQPGSVGPPRRDEDVTLPVNPIPLSPDWEAMRRDRDAAVREKS